MNGNVKYIVFGVCVALLILGASVGAASATTWYVDENRGTDFGRIPRAIDIATGGDWTAVYGWSYAEKTTATSPSIAIEAIEKDTTQGSVSIDNDVIGANINLLNTPSTLVFSQDFALDNIFEYGGGIYVDSDNNPSSGSSLPVEGCKVPISLIKDDIRWANATAVSEISGDNVPPTLISGAVDGENSTWGTDLTNFVFSVVYLDQDNDTPRYVKVTVNDMMYNMIKQDPMDTNYIDGCTYIYSISLPHCIYQYNFSTNDGYYQVSIDSLYSCPMKDEFVENATIIALKEHHKDPYNSIFTGDEVTDLVIYYLTVDSSNCSMFDCDYINKLIYKAYSFDYDTTVGVQVTKPQCVNVSIIEQNEIKFTGTAIEYQCLIGAAWWNVSIENLISGPQPCNDNITVSLYTYPPMGYADPNIIEGDKVEVYGKYIEGQYGCNVTLNGREEYYIKKVTGPKIIEVDDDFVDDPPNHKWDTIQEGVNDANEGDTVLVHSGTYYGNVVVNKSGITLKGIDNPVVEAGGFSVAPDGDVIENVLIEGFNLTSGQGIWCFAVNDSRFLNNTITQSGWSSAMLFEWSYNNTIIENKISDNDCGIQLFARCSNNTIIGNYILNNSIGINLIEFAGNNTIYHNNFVKNTVQALDDVDPAHWGANRWNNSYPSGGNYWSDYDEEGEGAVDEKSGPNQDEDGSDGIVDTPYDTIGDAGSRDDYPLMQQPGGEQLPDLTLSSSDISLSNQNPAEEENITINATIHNIGYVDANNVTIQFFDGNPDNGRQIGSDRIIYLLTAGRNETVNVTWVAQAGIYDIYVKIDPHGRTTESNESNNEAHKIVSIGDCTKDIFAQHFLLRHLNYDWNYDFYEAHHNYDDNATAPDPVKDPKGCTIPIDDSDIWIVHFSPTSPGFYPSSAAIMGPVIGFDTNSWYNWSTPVKNVFGTQETYYPEFELKSVDEWVSGFPGIGKDLEELLGDLLNASEFSIKLDGVYAHAPMRWDETTNRSSIPVKFSGRAIGPTGIGDGGDCEINFEKFCDIDDTLPSFGDTLDNIACRANIELPMKNIGYTKSEDISADPFEFHGTGMLNLELSPSADAGVRIRVDEPIAMAQAGMCELDATLNARAVGSFMGRFNLPSNIFDFTVNVDESLSTPTLENPVTFIGETVVPIQEFNGGDYIESVYTNFSGYHFKYEDLHEFIPVFRINTYPIVVNYSLCFNLTELGISCGHIDLPSEICLFDDGTLLYIDEWEYYCSFNDLTLHSPADVHIYDSLGRHIGPNATNGIDLEIPYSSYIVNGSIKRLTFPTTTDKFMLVLNGTDAGTYNMTVYRPILISGVNNTNIIKGITYRVDNIPTATGNIDYYNINFDEIEKQVNEKVHKGENIIDSINESFDLIISEKDVTKLPTTLFVSDAHGANGDQVVLHVRLMSLDKSLDAKTIVFKIDDNVVGQAIVDVNSSVTLNYTIPESMKIGIHEISTIYDGDSSYTRTEGYASLNVLNKPPEVQLDLPSPIVKGTLLVNGTIIDTNLEQTMLKIDNITVADSIPYLWDTTKYADGLHRIQLTAIDSFGEKDQSMAFVIVDNTLPSITITSPVNSTTYPAGSVNLNYSVSEPTVWKGYSLDGAVNVTLSGNTTLANLTECTHTVTAYANDTAGNMGYSTVWFTVHTAQKGDLNHDGTLTPADAAIALQLAATGGWDPAADVNHDNRITSLDALMILQAAGGAISL